MLWLWEKSGYVGYFVLLPLIKFYANHSAPRARVLIVHDESVLVVKNWLSGGSWALPGGGLERGESAVTASVREVQEELGLEIDPGSLVDLGQHRSIERAGLKSDYYLHATHLTERPLIKLRKYEIMDATWIPVSDLRQADAGVGSTAKDSLGVWSKSNNLV